MSYIKMNPQVKDIWVQALRSGKYKQGQETLRRVRFGGPYFCCLGVLCDIYARKHNLEWKKVGIDVSCLPNSSKTALISMEVREWSGLQHGEEAELVKLNDTHLQTLEQIADFVEREL